MHLIKLTSMFDKNLIYINVDEISDFYIFNEKSTRINMNNSTYIHVQESPEIVAQEISRILALS